jgi:hypothetical protein
MNDHTGTKEGIMQSPNGSISKLTTGLTLLTAALLTTLPAPALAKRGNIPVLQQVTRNTVGDVPEAEIRSVGHLHFHR